ncbi:MAG: PIN domain-containing protein [Candidatus Paceibacterota bacterium]|jgi:predicted ribonuclease YlaK
MSHSKHGRIKVTEEYKKTMVLDTNGLMDDTAAIFRFGEYDVFIPSVVIDELDHNKRDKMDGKNIRETISLFAQLIRGKTKEEIKKGFPLSPLFFSVLSSISDELKKENIPEKKKALEQRKDELLKKVKTIPTGLLFFQTQPPEKTSLLFTGDEGDDKILSVILDLKEKGKNIIFVTNDEAFQIKASIEGILVKSFEGENHGAKKRPWKRGYQDHLSRRHRPYWGGKKNKGAIVHSK